MVLDPPAPATWTAEPGPPEPKVLDAAAELAAHLGEGFGPDDGPDPTNPLDPCAGEKMARLQSYHRDILAGRSIGFLDKDLLLSRGGRLAFLRGCL
jgi:hypothetical protein